MSTLWHRDKDGQFVIKEDSFKSKTTVDGKSLYKRIHGTKFTVNTNSTNTCDFVIPYPHVKVEGIEVLNADLGDTCSFKVLDTANNDYSGLDPATYGPNVTLNQFAFDVYPRAGFYTHNSQYDADLYINTIIRVEYENTTSNKDIYVNYVLNEVKG
jgi:hypothetical protein